MIKVPKNEVVKADVIGLIPKGANHRITSTEINRLTNIKGSTIRKIVNNSRANFVPIASDEYGYFMAETPEELNHTIAQINSRIHKMIQAREGLKKAQILMKEKNNV
jgi:glutathionyl-hydroquinone reductase